MRPHLTLFAIALCLAAGPALADRDKDESGKGRNRAEKREDKRWEKEEKQREKEEKKREKQEKKRAKKDGDSYFHRHGYARLSIPRGHYPPPGMCRAWYPDRPPGHQPPPHKCNAAVPEGAWLIAHPREQRGRVRITAYDWRNAAPSPPPPPAVIYRDAPPPPPAVIYREAPPRPVLVLPPVLAVGEFNIADGVLLRVIVR